MSASEQLDPCLRADDNRALLARGGLIDTLFWYT